MVTGWRRIAHPGIADWSAAARPLAVQALRDSSEPLRCGGTWAVGLDLLPNTPDGSVGGVPLPWQALGLPPQPLHRAQLSAVYPGYPQPSPNETPTAFAFRQNRDAAHLDGLLAIGPEKRRMIREPHAWILGLPLTKADAGAAPLVVWEGSHRVMQAAMAQALAGHDPAQWRDVDVTEAYVAARRVVFATCPRVELPGRPGEAVLLHRHLLHGVAPWAEGAGAAPEGRIVAYFRPLMPSVATWVGEGEF